MATTIKGNERSRWWRDEILAVNHCNKHITRKYNFCLPCFGCPAKVFRGRYRSCTKRALRIVLPNCHYDDALIQSGITTPSQRREEACIYFIKRDCLSSPVLKPLIPCVSIDRPYCLRSGERVPVRLLACPQDKAVRRFLHHQVSRPVVILCSVIFSLLCSAFNHIYIIIYLIVFVLYCLLLLSLTFLVIQPLGCERDINKLLLLLLLLQRMPTFWPKFSIYLYSHTSSAAVPLNRVKSNIPSVYYWNITLYYVPPVCISS